MHTLHLSACPRLSDDALRFLFPALRNFALSECPLLTNQAVAHLLENAPCLEVWTWLLCLSP